MGPRPYSPPVATGAVESSHASARRDLVGRESLGALVLAASLPFLFFHERYQPELDVGIGSTTVDARSFSAADDPSRSLTSAMYTTAPSRQKVSAMA